MTKSATVLSDEERALIVEMATTGMGSMLISRAFAERGRVLPSTTIASLKLYRETRKALESIKADKLRAEEEAQREVHRLAVPDAPVFAKRVIQIRPSTPIWIPHFVEGGTVAVSVRAFSWDLTA